MATILVVDDAAFMRMRMSKILAEAGYEVIQRSPDRRSANHGELNLTRSIVDCPPGGYLFEWWGFQFVHPKPPKDDAA